MQKHILVLVLMFVAMSSAVWAECGKLCDENWWPTATASDVQAELDAGADVNARTENGYTPLHWAAWKNAETTEALITAGVDVNARAEGGRTPLLSAAILGTAEGVQLLIAAGADITAKDGFGRSVWDAAQKNEKLEGTETLWSLAEALGKCSRWCDADWWKQTTAADLQALLDAGAFTKLTKQDRATAWNLAKSSPLKGSAAYWALNDARFKQQTQTALLLKSYIASLKPRCRMCETQMCCFG